MVVILVYYKRKKKANFRYDFTKIPNFYFKLSTKIQKIHIL